MGEPRRLQRGGELKEVRPSDDQHQVIAVNDLVIEGRAEHWRASSVRRPRILGRRPCVVGESAGELLAGGSRMPTTSPFVELADHLDDADGQQALGAGFQRRAPVVDDVMSRGGGRSGRSSVFVLYPLRRAPGTSVPTGSPARMRVSGSAWFPMR